MANPPITIGPFTNVPAPGSPIKSDWPQQITTHVVNLAAIFKTGTYSPALTGMAIGSGGQNTADYTFVGGYPAGSPGLLEIVGTIVFGSSGQSYPQADTRIALPSGYTAVTASPDLFVGHVAFVDTGVGGYTGRARAESASTIRFIAEDTAGAYGKVATLSPAIPFAWGPGDAIQYSAVVRAIKAAAG